MVTTAARGLTGNWLIDPADLEVVAGTGGAIVSGTNSPTTASTIGAGTIVRALNTTNVDLQATNSITVNAAIDASGNTNGRNLRLTAPIANLNQVIKLKAGSILRGTATTVTVGVNGTVQNGIDVASVTTSGTVNLASATYKQGRTINIAKNVTVRGTGEASTIISGENLYRVFNIVSGNVTLDKMSIVNGSTAGNGGGIYSQDAFVTVNNSTINGNSARNGGGLYVLDFSNVRINNSTISNNSGLVDAGGIYNTGSLTVSNSTLRNNSTNGSGGAIFGAYSNNKIAVLSSTISGNSAQGGGGAVYNDNGTIRISSSTITGNSAKDGGGIENNFISGLTIGNTIVSGNTSRLDPTKNEINNTSTIINLGYNLFGFSGNSGVHNVNVATTDITPTAELNDILAPLGNYGGTTQTHALLPGSPAIDAGNAASTTLDQRGRTRVGTADIGAFESKGFTFSATAGTPQSQTVAKEFTTPLTIKVTANDALEPVQGGIVTFTAPTSIATATLSQINAKIDASGNAKTIATANQKVGAYKVTARIRGIATGADFNLTNTADVANSIVTTSGSDQTAIVDRNFTNNLVATVTDQFGNPVQDSTVSFTLPSEGSAGGVLDASNSYQTDINGKVSIVIKANTKAGAFTTTGNVSGVSTGADFNLTNTADIANSIVTTSGSDQTAIVDRNFTNNLVAIVTDRFNNPVQGSTVTFSLPGEGLAGGVLDVSNSYQTDVNGKVSIAIKANTKAGAFKTTGTIANIALGADFNLINTADIANSIVTTSGSDQSTTVDRNFTNNLVATVTDRFGNPVQGSTVTFSRPGTGASGVFAQNTATTDMNGVATIAIKANTKAGKFTTTGSVSGVATGANFALTNTVDRPYQIKLLTKPETIRLGQVFTSTIRTQVVDQFNNPIANQSVLFTLPNTGASGIFSNGNNTITLITDANGMITLSLKNNPIAGFYNGNAQVPSGPITQFSLVNGKIQTEGLYTGKEIPKHSPIVPTSNILCAVREAGTELSKTDPYKGLPSCVSQSSARKTSKLQKIGDNSTDR